MDFSNEVMATMVIIVMGFVAVWFSLMGVISFFRRRSGNRIYQKMRDNYNGRAGTQVKYEKKPSRKDLKAAKKSDMIKVKARVRS